MKLVRVPKIYTTYFAQLRNLPPNIVPISICGKVPSWYKGIQYKKLAPNYSFFSVWKETKDNDYFIEHFNNEILSHLTQSEVVNDLFKLSENHSVALVCYEKPTDFCHRHLVSKWLSEDSVKVEEWRN